MKEQIKTHRIHIKKKFREARGFKFTYILTVNYVTTPYSQTLLQKLKVNSMGRKCTLRRKKLGSKMNGKSYSQLEKLVKFKFAGESAKCHS